MTILPKRNKRRLDQRENEVGHHTIPQSGLETVPPTTQQHLTHHLGHHGLANPIHDSQDPILPQHTIINNQTLSEPLRGGHTSHRNEVVARKLSSESSRHRRSPIPIRIGNTKTNDDVHIIPHKKSKRGKTKLSKHHIDPLRRHIHSTNSSLIPLSVNIPYPSTNQNHSPLVGPTSSRITDASRHSPNSQKLLGGAQETSGPGRGASNFLPETTSERSQASTPSDDGHNKPPGSPGECNSEDEHLAPSYPFNQELETTFERALNKELGLHIKQMETDGSCLFRAIADQVYGDQDMHDVVRGHCIDYMTKNADHFSHYVTEDFNTYLRRKKQLGCFGNHVEVQALSEMYNRPIEVYQYSIKPINIFHGATSDEKMHPIRLSYHSNSHYNSLVDPKHPTIGIGLGLPGLRPGMSEHKLLEDVKEKSLHYQLEKTMLNDKLRETDWELTDDAIQEQVARESYLQWIQDRQKRERRPPASTVTGPSCSADPHEDINWNEKLSHVTSPAVSPKLPKPLSPRLSPNRCASSRSSRSPPKTASKTVKSPPESKNDEGASGSQYDTVALDLSKPSSSSDINVDLETETFPNLEPFTVYSYNDNIDESEAIARAIEESQRDYLRCLSK